MDINSLGFRDREIPRLKQDNEIRILVLGDSITWGSALQAEGVFVERIEHYLGASMNDKVIEVINAGVENVGIRDEIQILEEKGLSTDPDIVILAFYMNDSGPSWGFTDELEGRGFLRKHSVFAEKIYRKILFRKWINERGENSFAWIKA